MMTWHSHVVSPPRPGPPKRDMRHVCPGLYRFTGSIALMGVSAGVYQSGLKLLGVPPIDWSAPQWDWKLLTVVIASGLLGLIAMLMGAGLGMLIPVRNRRLNDFIIVLWSCCATGGILWLVTFGLSMTVALGKQPARDLVIQYGADRALLHVIIAGLIVSSLLAVLFFRFPPALYYLLGLAATCLIAYGLFQRFAIASPSWLMPALVVTFVLPKLAMPYIRRDLRERQQAQD